MKIGRLEITPTARWIMGEDGDRWYLFPEALEDIFSVAPPGFDVKNGWDDVRPVGDNKGISHDSGLIRESAFLRNIQEALQSHTHRCVLCGAERND